LSVYTTVGRDELSAWLAPLGAGALEDFAGIAAGMQNSNYFVTAGGSRWVLTLFERLAPRELGFYLDLQDHLAVRGIPCPRPLATGDGHLWRMLAGKPAALFTCLPGVYIEAPTPAHCQGLGEMLARLHLAGADFAKPLPNPCGAVWRATTGRALAPLLSEDERGRLLAELDFQAAQDYSALPRGIVHGDLFATMPCGRASGSLACSISISPVKTACCSIWRSPPTTGATMPHTCRRWLPATVPGVRWRRLRKPPGRPCAAPPRCASGCCGWRSGTTRAPAKW